MVRKYLPVKTRYETSKVYLEEIIYIEKDRRRAKLITVNGIITIYCGMDFLKQYTDERFLHCHRSYLFNMDKIKAMKEQTLHMENGDCIPLGRDCFRAARKTFDSYLHRKKDS